MHKKNIFSILFLLSVSVFGQSQNNEQLLLAVNENDFNKVKELVDAGANINARDSNLATILMWAALKSDLSIVQYLVSKGSSTADKGVIYLNEQKTIYYGNLIGIAAGEGKTELLRFLIEKCKIDVEDKEYDTDTNTETGWTALQWAASSGREDAVKYLINKGANINANHTTDRGTPLIYALKKNHKSVAALLINKGAKVNKATDKNTTALIYAVLNTDFETCVLLWKHKASFTVKTTNGKTALDFAIEKGPSRVLDFLNNPGNYKSIRIKEYWEELEKQFLELYNNEEYEKGIPIAKKAVEAAKKEFGENHQYYGSSLNSLALFYSKMNQYEKAESLYVKALAIGKKVLGENHSDIAAGLNNLAMLYESMGQYKKAEPMCMEALAIREKIFGKNHEDYSTSLNNLAELYEIMGWYEKAEPMFLEAMTIDKKIFGKNHENYSTSLNNLARLYKSMGRYEKAEPMFLEAMEIDKKILGQNHSDYATVLDNLAGLYNNMSRFEKAEPLYVEVLTIRKKVLGENHVDYAASLNNLAVLYKRMGRYEKAEPMFEEAMSIYKKIVGENHSDYASIMLNKAGLYSNTGRYEKAEPLYKKVMAIWKKVLGESHPNCATVLIDLARLYQSMGQYEKAEPLLVEGIAINKKQLGETHPQYTASLANLAHFYSGMGQFEKAEPLYEEAMEIDKKRVGENHLKYAYDLSNLAMLYRNMGRYEKAEPLFMKAMEIQEKGLGENHPDYATNLIGLALLYMSMNGYEKAEPLLLQYTGIIIHNLENNFTNLSEEEKQSYLNSIVLTEKINNSFLYNYNKASSIAIQNISNTNLFFKGLILDETKKMLTFLEQSKDTIVKEIYNKWRTNKNVLSIQYSLPVTSRRTDIKQMEEITESLEKELTRRSSEFKKQQHSQHINTKDVQKGLEKDEAAIEFVKFRQLNKKKTDSIIYAAYIIRKNDSIPVFIPLCEEKQLQQLFDSAGKTASSMVSKLYRGLKIKDKSSASLGTGLYKLVWAPLEPYLKGIKKISYSPAGKLYSIAFHALPADSNTLLIDKYALQQYTSTRQVALRTDDIQPTKPSGIVLFGDANFSMDSIALVKQRTNRPGTEVVSTSIYTPQNRGSRGGVWNSLPGTAEEVKKIKGLFDHNKISTKSFIQTAASEENLKALSGKSPQILHIATHGFFLPEPDKKKREPGFDQGNTYTLADDPLLRSGLVLSGGNYAWSGKTPIEGIEDGIATAYEISQLNLSNTELVVLSACETALGDVKGSEGVFGLQRAFKMAGVKKLIVSLWQVPDKETAELMTTFYTYWMKGKSINESFTQAQADVRKKYSQFYWAAFVLVE